MTLFIPGFKILTAFEVLGDLYFQRDEIAHLPGCQKAVHVTKGVISALTVCGAELSAYLNLLQGATHMTHVGARLGSRFEERDELENGLLIYGVAGDVAEFVFLPFFYLNRQSGIVLSQAPDTDLKALGSTFALEYGGLAALWAKDAAVECLQKKELAESPIEEPQQPPEQEEERELFLKLDARIPYNKLLKQKKIPKELESDRVLSRYKCDITNRLLRFPMRIEVCGVKEPFYCEAGAIKPSKLADDALVPGLNRPFGDVVEIRLDRLMLSKIDGRLREISDRIAQLKGINIVQADPDSWKSQIAQGAISFLGSGLTAYEDSHPKIRVMTKILDDKTQPQQDKAVAGISFASMLTSGVVSTLVSRLLTGLYSSIHKGWLEQSEDDLTILAHQTILPREEFIRDPETGGKTFYHFS